LASLGYAQKLNDIVFSIFKGLKFGDTEGVKSAKAKVIELGATSSDPKEQARITSKAMRDALSSQAFLNKQQEGIKKQSETLNKLESALTSKEPDDKAINKLIDKLPVSDETKKQFKANKKNALEFIKGQKESLKVLDEQNKKSLEGQAEIYNNGQKMLKALNEVDKGTAQIAEIFLKTQDPEKIGDMIATDIEKGMSMKDLKDKYGSATDIAGYAKSSARGSKALESLRDRYKDNLVGAPTEEESLKMGQTTPLKTPEKKATLNIPEIVTSPGIVKLDPGEMILPKTSNFKTIPADKMAGPTKGTGSKNISIVVNANERDLAQRISNEIRSILYNEQVTGMR
jgi:hypothetical protein